MFETCLTREGEFIHSFMRIWDEDQRTTERVSKRKEEHRNMRRQRFFRKVLNWKALSEKWKNQQVSIITVSRASTASHRPIDRQPYTRLAQCGRFGIFVALLSVVHRRSSYKCLSKWSNMCARCVAWWVDSFKSIVVDDRTLIKFISISLKCSQITVCFRLLSIYDRATHPSVCRFSVENRWLCTGCGRRSDRYGPVSTFGEKSAQQSTRIARANYALFPQCDAWWAVKRYGPLD